MRARGFLIGATSGRTTLNGEGLQHEDGHSQIQAAVNPQLPLYDPTYACELAVICKDGMRRICEKAEDAFYYITVTNENYATRRCRRARRPTFARACIACARPISKSPRRARTSRQRRDLREAVAAAEMLAADSASPPMFGARRVLTNWRATGKIARAGICCIRRKAALESCRKIARADKGPVIAATDYVRLFADQIRAFVPRRYAVLGADGFGRSDTREKPARAF